METRLLARLIEAARTVAPITALTASTALPSKAATGDNMLGEVAAQLDNGRFRVLIDGKPLVLKLPTGVKTGDTVLLRMTGGEPRLQLVLGPRPGTQPNADVSGAGRLIGSLVNEAAGPPVRQMLPIVAEPTTEPSELTGHLARAIERSGLFYESHQARWIGGDFPLERLREEPQAGARIQSSPTAPEDAPPGQRSAAAASPAPPLADAVQTKPSNVTTQDTRDAVGDSRTNEVRSDVAARETLPIVRQQLETLETRNLSWMGEIWSGQAMRWEISEDRPENEAETDPADWSTRFGLTLPTLGEIGATLVVTPKGIRIALSAQAPDTVDAMRSAAPDLARALEAAGVAMTGLQVIQGDAPV